MLTQDEIRRAMYEDREKARRDAASWQSTVEHLRHEIVLTGARRELIGQIRAYERVLGQEATSADQLAAMSLDELKQRVDELEVQLDGEDQS